MRHQLKNTLLIIIGLAFSAVAAADLTGTWLLTVESDQGTSNPSVVLKQEGNELTGTYKSPQLGETPLTGSVDGDSFKFKVSLSMQGQDFAIDYSGKANGGEMSGELDLAGMGGAKFTGKKQ